MVAFHTIKIKALRAEGLVKPDSWFFKSVDPYLELWFGGESYATSVVDDSESPVFDHTFEMKSHEGSNKSECKEIIFRVLDKYAINCFTEPLGEARVSPASLCQGPLTLLLKEPGEDKKSPATVGKLHLVVESDGSAVMPELAVIATIKKTHPRNLMAKFWSEKYYYSLGPEKRKRLLACCKSGYENPESEVGIHVEKPEDEKEFKEYFEKVYKEVDANAAEKQRLEEAKRKEAENEADATRQAEETLHARAAQDAAEARAAEEARLKMLRHAAEEEKNSAARKLAARRSEIEKQVAELRRNAEEKARAVKKAAEEREVVQNKAAMEKAMVEATAKVEGAAAAKAEAERKAQEDAEMADQSAREEAERREQHAREEAEAAERMSHEERQAAERKAAKETKAAEKKRTDAIISKASGAKKADDEKAKADQAVLQAKLVHDRVNAEAKNFISKNDETWKPPTVSAVQAAAEKARAEQAVLDAKMARERADSDNAKTFISKNDETKSPAVLTPLRSPLPAPKPFPAFVNPPPDSANPPPETNGDAEVNTETKGDAEVNTETNGNAEVDTEAEEDAQSNKKNKKKAGKK